MNKQMCANQSAQLCISGATWVKLQYKLWAPARITSVNMVPSDNRSKHTHYRCLPHLYVHSERCS